MGSTGEHGWEDEGRRVDGGGWGRGVRSQDKHTDAGAAAAAAAAARVTSQALGVLCVFWFCLFFCLVCNRSLLQLVDTISPTLFLD